MRRILISTSLVFTLATSMIIASAQAGTAQQPAQANSVNAPERAQKTTAHPSARSKYRKAASKKSAKRNDYRPDYNQNAVEVMNGSSTSRVVFDDEKNTPEAAKADPSQLKVEVVNGNSTDTRYFHLDENAQQTEAAMSKQPVVVGIESSDTRFAGGNKNPVVTGITAAGQNDATKVRGGGQKLTNGVSPQPKRPPYEPDTH
jgi:hypothetical protein